MRQPKEGETETNESLGKVKNIKIEHKPPQYASSTDEYTLMSPEEVSEYFDNIPMTEEKKNGKN
jgi:hypothetical protein